MSVKNLLEKIAKLPSGPSDIPEVPPPELVGLLIRSDRAMKIWKQSTLADFARVSLSTIERAERGERVSEKSLDLIAQALGFEHGDFTRPRLRRSNEEVAVELADTFGHLEPVRVKRMHTHRQVREAINCHAFLIHRPEVPESYDSDIAHLIEWLDLGSFILLSDYNCVPRQELVRRDLYNDILRFVSELERHGLTVLSGAMPAPYEGIPDWKIAVISVTPRLSDPGAIKRRHIFIDRRLVQEGAPYAYHHSGSAALAWLQMEAPSHPD